MTALDDREGTMLDLVVSIEPAVVFADLAARCAATLCDEVTIDLIDGRADGGTPARYRIAELSGPGVAGPAGLAHDVVQVSFSHPRTPEHGEFSGAAAFAWTGRPATSGDRALAGALVDCAVRTVAWQRSAEVAEATAVKVENLTIALQSSRHIGAAIGILMSQRKVTEEQAFELLRSASQHAHRKLRELALDVLETGWLDPAILP